ncbi:MAG: serine/threonine-protein kinase [Pseudomonadota bacterium]
MRFGPMHPVCKEASETLGMTVAASDMQIASHPGLPEGTVLADGLFTITSALGAGGFGITYRATDNVLGRPVVIKECFPDDFCLRGEDRRTVILRSAEKAEQVESIVRMFMSEARAIAKLRHPTIVGVHSAFEENNTAYMALDLLDGTDLFNLIVAQKDNGFSPAWVTQTLLQLLDAIEQVHAADLLHRDISPDNIMIEPSGNPVLIDFGAARGDASRRTRAVSSLLVVKDGYSPHEFYAPGSTQTPSSDLYALAATFYHVISGKAPVNSQTRVMEIANQKPDPFLPLAGRIQGYDDAFLQAIDQAMRIMPNERIASAAQWRDIIKSSAAAQAEQIKAAQPAAPIQPDPNLEKKLTALIESTNAEVRKSAGRKPKLPPAPKPVATSRPPEWVEEFNREGRAIQAEKARSRLLGLEDAPEQGAAAAADPFGREGRPSTDTDWVEKAKEKQDRMREEREQDWAAYQAEQRPQSRAVASSGEPGVSPTDGAPGDPQTEPGMSVGTVIKYLLVSVFIGLCGFGAVLLVA